MKVYQTVHVFGSMAMSIDIRLCSVSDYLHDMKYQARDDDVNVTAGKCGLCSLLYSLQKDARRHATGERE